MADWHSGRQNPMSATREMASMKTSTEALHCSTGCHCHSSSHQGALFWTPLLDRASLWHHMACL